MANHPSNPLDGLVLQVHSDRLQGELECLAAISDCPEPPPAVTRVVFSEKDLEARAYLRSLYEAAGLAVRVDPIGNTFARWTGSEPEAAAVGTGSHTDAIPYAGMYDGTVGVLGGLEAIRSLQRAGFRPRRSIELVMLTSEEPTRFGIGCAGSRAMAGLLDSAGFARLRDNDGDDFDTVRQRAGFSGELRDTVLPRDYFSAWIELHIEQGPELEKAGLPIGIVTAIAAPATLVFEVEGEGGHAGAVLMPARRDALTGAAEMVTTIERTARQSASSDLVATVGKLDIHPGALNSIPSRVRFTLDIRDIDQGHRDRAIEAIRSEILRIGEERQLGTDIEQLNADAPATCDPAIFTATERAAEHLGLAHRTLISRAYHDSLFIGHIAPIGMVFIPCKGGISHRPDEYASPKDIATGVEVLALTLADLAA